MRIFACLLIMFMSHMLTAQFLNPTLDEWIDSSPMFPFEHLADWKTTSQIYQAAPSLSVKRATEGERIFARITSMGPGTDSTSPGYLEQAISTQNLRSISYISRCDSLVKLGLCIVRLSSPDGGVFLSDTIAVTSDTFSLRTIEIDPDITLNHERITVTFEANGYYFPPEPEGNGFATFDIDEVRADFISSVDNQILNENLLSVFPNPSRGVFDLDLDEKLKPDLLQVFNFQGQVVLSGKFKSRLNLSELGSGNYILSIQTPDGVLSKKISIL